MSSRRSFAITKEKVKLFFGLLVFKILLDFVYISFVNKVFWSDNFMLDYNLKKYIISFIWFVIICFALPKNKNRPSTIILLLHFLIMILPIFTIYAFKDESDFYFIVVNICFMVECILVKYSHGIRIYKIENAKYLFYFIIGFITILVYSSMILANGMPSLDALNIYNVYNIRANVKYPYLMNYLVAWQAKIINPLMIASFFYNKKHKSLIFFVLLQLLIYLITGHKTYLFITVAIIVIMYVFKYKNLLSGITLLSVFGCVISYILYKIEITMTLADIFIRRFLFVPAQLKFYYYDFVSQNEFLYFSEGVIGKLFNVKYPYEMRFVNLISDVYFNRPNMTASTGYLGSGYANFGFVGVGIYTLIISIILIIIDSFGKKINNSLITGIVLFSIIILNESDLLTTLLSGGLMLLLILLYLFASMQKRNV